MDDITLAYLAGAMDSDGYFTIRRSTYRKRVVGDTVNPTFSENAGLKQVVPTIPKLLHDLFSGSFYRGKSQTANSRPPYIFVVTNKKAITLCNALLPYLRVKRKQVEVLLELRKSKSDKYYRVAYWFEKEFPDWTQMELITTTEVVKILGYTNRNSVSQAISNGLLLALPYKQRGKEVPRIPKLLVERVAQCTGRDGHKVQPPQLVAWRQSLYEQVKELNKMGVHGTPVYHRTGPYTLAE